MEDDQSGARLFLGLPPDDAARRALARIRFGPGRYADPGLYHITLCFLGCLPRAEIPRLAEILQSAPRARFPVAVDRLGAFKNGTILCGFLSAPDPRLFALQAALSDSLRAAGYRLEPGGYTPHVTLARNARALPPYPRVDPIVFTAECAHLYESARVNGVLTYAPLATARFS